MTDKAKKPEQTLNVLSEMRECLHKQEQSHDLDKGFIESPVTLKKAFDTMQIGVTISDVNGRIVYINSADANMHGYEVEELLGAEVRVFSPTKLWKPMNLKEIKSLHKWKRESTNLRKDGSVFSVQLMSDVITDTGGELIGVITTCEDITERKEMEKKVKESEE